MSQVCDLLSPAILGILGFDTALLHSAKPFLNKGGDFNGHSLEFPVCVPLYVSFQNGVHNVVKLLPPVLCAGWGPLELRMVV